MVKVEYLLYARFQGHRFRRINICIRTVCIVTGQEYPVAVNTDSQPRVIKVWDPLIRSFHWLLLLSFVIAYGAIRSGMQELHIISGYVLAGLLVIRGIWGVIGSTHARFVNFVYRPQTVMHYLRSILQGRPERHLGHNPAGGMMVIGLLLFLFAVVSSGLVISAAIEFEGPLLGLFAGLSDAWAYRLADFHRLAVDVIWFMVLLHVAGVLLASIQHRENLVLSMFSGHKKCAE